MFIPGLWVLLWCRTGAGMRRGDGTKYVWAFHPAMFQSKSLSLRIWLSSSTLLWKCVCPDREEQFILNIVLDFIISTFRHVVLCLEHRPPFVLFLCDLQMLVSNLLQLQPFWFKFNQSRESNYPPPSKRSLDIFSAWVIFGHIPASESIHHRGNRLSQAPYAIP